MGWRRLIVPVASAAVVLPFSYVVAALLRIPQPFRLVAALILGLVAPLGSAAVLKGMQNAAAGGILAFVNPSGDGNRPETLISSSAIEALIAAGHTGTALAMLQRRLQTDDHDYDAFWLAAELHLAMPGGVREAVRRLVALRNSPAAAIGLRIRAAFRLADVFSQALGNNSAAESQLKWVVATFPRTRAATHARAALERGVTPSS